MARPLSIAIASGASPAQGLYTAIIGGFLVSALGGSRHQIGGPTGGLETQAEAVADRITSEKFGVVIAASSAVMRWIVNPEAEVDYEDRWSDRSVSVFQRVLGRAPSLDVCAYSHCDLEALAKQIDLLDAIPTPFATHMKIFAVDYGGEVLPGREAVAAVLSDSRPGGIGSSAWRSICDAAAPADAGSADPAARDWAFPWPPTASAAGPRGKDGISESSETAPPLSRHRMRGLSCRAGPGPGRSHRPIVAPIAAAVRGPVFARRRRAAPAWQRGCATPIRRGLQAGGTMSQGRAVRRY